jgi:uncharacterized protein (TIGR03083 family)
VTGVDDHDRDEWNDIALFLKDLTPEQWDAPTLCSEWRVRDVVGHMLATYERGFTAMIGVLARHRFSPDAAVGAIAVDRVRDRPPAELLDSWTAQTRRGGVSRALPVKGLFYDHFVHHQDMRRPLGMPRVIPPDRLVALLDVAPTYGGFRSKQRARGLRLEATDVDWSFGSGPEVHGPAEAMLMALSGRPVALAELAGDGVPTLTARVNP